MLFYEPKSLKSILNVNYAVANANYGVPRKVCNVFRFINDLIAINGGNEFESQNMTWTKLEKGKHFIQRLLFKTLIST